MRCSLRAFLLLALFLVPYSVFLATPVHARQLVVDSEDPKFNYFLNHAVVIGAGELNTTLTNALITSPELILTNPLTGKGDFTLGFGEFLPNFAPEKTVEDQELTFQEANYTSEKYATNPNTLYEVCQRDGITDPIQCASQKGVSLPSGKTNQLAYKDNLLQTPREQWRRGKTRCNQVSMCLNDSEPDSLACDPQVDLERAQAICNQFPDTYDDYKALTASTKIAKTPPISTATLPVILVTIREAEPDNILARFVSRYTISITSAQVVGPSEATQDLQALYNPPADSASAIKSIKNLAKPVKANTNDPDRIIADNPTDQLILDKVDSGKNCTPSSLKDTQFMGAVQKQEPQTRGLLSWLVSLLPGQNISLNFKVCAIISEPHAILSDLYGSSKYAIPNNFLTVADQAKQTKKIGIPIPINSQTQSQLLTPPSEMKSSNKTIFKAGGSPPSDGTLPGGEHPQGIMIIKNLFSPFATRPFPDPCYHANIPNLLTKFLATISLGAINVGANCPAPAAPTPPSGGACTDFAYVEANIDAAIASAAAKYAQFFPTIGQGGLADLLKAIYDTESLPYQVDPQSFIDPTNPNACNINTSDAAGPFQIKTGTYEDITNNCSGEFGVNDREVCDGSILSRCDPFDAAELAARALLYSHGYWIFTPNHCPTDLAARANPIPTAKELYEALCNYGEGSTPLPHLGGKTSCQYIYEDVLGWPIP